MKKSISPSKISGPVTIPGSKSHTIRALLIATLAEGTSVIRRPLYSSDTLSCIEACRHLGADITVDPELMTVKGTAGVISSDGEVIDVGNSGTTLYLATAIAALSSDEIHFTGDEQIQRRSAAKLLNSLEDFSVIVKSNNGCAPFSIKGPMKSGKTSIECPTSQYLSALLLAAPLADGNLDISVPLLNEVPYVEMTLQWLEKQHVMLQNKDFKEFYIPGGQSYQSFDTIIPADFSSASFFFCAAAITQCKLTLLGLDMNDCQGDKEIVNILRLMGAETEINKSSISIQGRPLRGREIDLNAMPDALPILAVTAAFASGSTRFVNVAHARLKETDRVAVMATELRKLGILTEEHPDGLTVHGGTLQGGIVEGHHDHRIVMAFAVAGLAAQGPITITTSEAAEITFPNFFELIDQIKK